jgi:uncharacterized membrane protein
MLIQLITAIGLALLSIFLFIMAGQIRKHEKDRK